MSAPIARTAVAIRSIRETDAPAAARLLGELGYPAGPDALRERIRRFLGLPSETVLVAEAEGRVLGLIALHRTERFHESRPSLRIVALCVTEAARGRGVGRALVRQAEALALREGCAEIEVSSNARRAPAHAFYDALGYEETHRLFDKPAGGRGETPCGS
jgi:GNAT superfamily N-acetyltransferase